ncbi:RNA 2',3'-cyclic phosphodiesterase [Mobilicoccus massiliensis]|uniref:RNA 2',3'-cyclic phosphodiesterase n=1 Tax=Mobilicoccus massiliensis TaxID=1522310 RepID=UPI00159669B4|nr:RNA 2',3'-cyclic phosphodiesterase [Mobilicoccus massiliensis]
MSLPVPEDVRAHLDAFLEPRRLAEDTLRWSSPERWHLTLAFMPDVSEVDLEDLQERLEAACARRRPLELRLRGGGVFGSARKARVLWANVAMPASDREELDLLAVGARHAAAAAGTVVEGGQFVPHLTLARTPRPRELGHLLQVLDVYESPSWTARSADLVASELTPVVRHEVLSTHRLGPPDPDEEKWWRRGILGRQEPAE